MNRLRVLVADDSAAARVLLCTILSGDPEIEVVGEATDGAEAVSLARALRPDVITMDVNMPALDGFEATERIMEEQPRPIVMVSAVVLPDALNSFRALEAGAVALLEKPGGPSGPDFTARAADLVRTVKLMADVRLVRRSFRSRPHREPSALRLPPARQPLEIVGMAASTGGPPVLATILSALPGTFPAPIVCVQHIGRGFDVGLARYLDGETALPVALAEDGMALRPGMVLVAPAHAHVGVTSTSRLSLTPSGPADPYVPSADRLFSSLARVYGPGALGVVLTGMGRDGATGLLELRRAGGGGIAQDEATSAVFGMPRRAVEEGGVEAVLAAEDIADALLVRAGVPYSNAP